MEIQELKAQAFDKIVEIEKKNQEIRQLQQELHTINQQINGIAK